MTDGFTFIYPWEQRKLLEFVIQENNLKKRDLEKTWVYVTWTNSQHEFPFQFLQQNFTSGHFYFAVDVTPETLLYGSNKDMKQVVEDFSTFDEYDNIPAHVHERATLLTLADVLGYLNETGVRSRLASRYIRTWLYRKVDGLV